jgi:hypothetical protein
MTGFGFTARPGQTRTISIHNVNRTNHGSFGPSSFRPTLQKKGLKQKATTSMNRLGESAPAPTTEAGNRHSERVPAVPEPISKEAIGQLPNNTNLQILLRNGTRLTGKLQRSAGWPWLSSPQTEPFNLSPFCPEFEQIDQTCVLPDSPSTDQATRKFGIPAYKQPHTRHQYEETLWQLAATVIQTKKQANIDDQNYRAITLRAMQLECQFDSLADQITLAKTKRRYILLMALRRQRGERLLHPEELMGSALDARAVQVPKHNDFDPDPKVRKSRSLAPPIAYETEAQIEASLEDARKRLARRKMSKKRRIQFGKIVEKRLMQLRKGNYREAIQAKIAQQRSEQNELFQLPTL